MIWLALILAWSAVLWPVAVLTGACMRVGGAATPDTPVRHVSERGQFVDRWV